MKLLKYELTDWTRYNQNFYRSNSNLDTIRDCRVGLIIQTNVKDITVDDCYWNFDVYIPMQSSLIKKMYSLYNNMYGNGIKPRYTYSQLETAKNNIDRFIEKINKLKAFI